MKVSHKEAVMTGGICETEEARAKKDVRAQYENMKSQTAMTPFFLGFDEVSF